jgi:type 1 glutamine amidotransferase
MKNSRMDPMNPNRLFSLSSTCGAEGRGEEVPISSDFVTRFMWRGFPLAGFCSAPVLACLLLMSVLGQGWSQTPVTPPARKARILLVTGDDHPAHHWKETAPVLQAALEKDRRLEVFVAQDPAFLDSAAIDRYDLILLHFKNWQTNGPGDKARENLRRFVHNGKGLALVHFACGAWQGEWPEFSDLAGRVYDPALRHHDPYGPFRVEIVQPEHPIVRGMEDFDTQDELYTCLTGGHPIQVVAQAKSKVDGKYYPMAFVSQYGEGRTFQCVLGHDVKAMGVPAVQELYRRGCAWAAGLDPLPHSK